MMCAGCTIPPSEMCRRYYPRDKYATTTTTTAAAPPKPQPVRFTKLAQNGEGEKTVGKRQHTHSHTLLQYSLHRLLSDHNIHSYTIHSPLYTCTANILGCGNHYRKHSMMTMRLKTWYVAILDRSQVLFCHKFESTTHLKCCITGLSLRAGLIHASEMFIHLWSRRDPHS